MFNQDLKMVELNSLKIHCISNPKSPKECAEFVPNEQICLHGMHCDRSLVCSVFCYAIHAMLSHLICVQLCDLFDKIKPILPIKSMGWQTRFILKLKLICCEKVVYVFVGGKRKHNEK